MDTNTKIAASPLVSILMLTYNRERYLQSAITSVLSQTYTNWELVIIDDGSTDNSVAVIDSFNDPRITYHTHAENEGLLKSRQESLERARGEYVAVLDSDDLWRAEDKLEKQVAFLETHPHCVVVGTFIEKIDADGNRIGTDTYATTDTEIRDQILVRNQFAHSSVLMRKRALEKTAGYRSALAEDLDLFLQLGKFGEFANLKETLTSYRIHPHSANDRGAQMAKAIHSILIRYKNEYPHYHKALLKNYMRLFRAYLSF